MATNKHRYEQEVHLREIQYAKNNQIENRMERSLILSYIKELPLEAAKKLVNFKKITAESASIEANAALTYDEAEYWKNLYFRCQSNNIALYRMSNEIVEGDE